MRGTEFHFPAIADACLTPIDSNVSASPRRASMNERCDRAMTPRAGQHAHRMLRAEPRNEATARDILSMTTPVPLNTLISVDDLPQQTHI